MMRSLSLALALLFSLYILPVGAAGLNPVDAPEQTHCSFQDHMDVTIEYEPMRMNGRKIFGDLVPYGKIWEMGDKRSPSFVTSANLMVGGKEVPAGHYSLLMLPDQDRWRMVVKKMASGESHKGNDEVARIDLMVRRLPSPLDVLRISFDEMKGGCVLTMRWEQTEASALLAEKK